ncbi:hypothetical protein [Planktothrix agardhii]|uniref:hypothetical protein n=1 Tax=Planktothrix agardhii TaxID=1160 RepID=UPI0020B185B2|nr:hypothetical protein [Planktothrix agardhii]MCP9294521.1 hypothetical protein [Planktothrix agardhii LY1]CAD5954467.1 hypothetical protein PCC7811_02756 [Planktothrix agardhii]
MKELEPEVYVRSYALGNTGIHWRKIENIQSISESPNMLKERLVKKKTGDLGTIGYLINYQNLSLVLMRYSQQLLFMVAGIESVKKQTNKFGSTIETEVYNAVAWVVNPDESNIISDDKELMLRHLAARSLLSFVGKDKDPEFINTINEAINFKGLEEFEVNLNKINQLTENSADKLEQLLPNLDKAEGDQQIWYKKVEKTSNEQEIISLAEKIINTGLPEDDLAILISKVDGNAVSVLPIDLKPEISDIKIETSTDNQAQEVTEQTENIVENKEVVEGTLGKKRKQLLLLIILIVSLLVVILFSLKTMENQKEKPEKIPVPQTLINPQSLTLTNTKI